MKSTCKQLWVIFMGHVFVLCSNGKTGACPGFLKGGGSNISWFPKKRSSDFKGGGSNGLMGGGVPVH